MVDTVIYVFLLLCLYILIVCLCIFIVPTGTLRLPWLRFFHVLFSVVRQMPGYNSQRRGTARTLPNFLCCSTFFLCVLLCIVCVYMCTVLLSPSGYPIAVNKYIISYRKKLNRGVLWRVYMVGEVKWSEVKWVEVQWSEVKVLLKVMCYTCGLTTLENKYS